MLFFYPASVYLQSKYSDAILYRQRNLSYLGNHICHLTNRYFPAFVQINKAGDINVQQSAVKIWEADNPKISETNKIIKVVK